MPIGFQTHRNDSIDIALLDQTASATVVADDMTRAPVALTRLSKSSSGKPKWKLTTSGRISSTMAQKSSPKGARFEVGGAPVGSSPSST